MKKLRAAALAILAALVAANGSWAAPPLSGVSEAAWWRDPSDLPRGFRKNCVPGSWYARGYCSYHCGSAFQFYYCSGRSFGCCHPGKGYCDWDGLLRCSP
jgi:hypothetical protein